MKLTQQASYLFHPSTIIYLFLLLMNSFISETTLTKSIFIFILFFIVTKILLFHKTFTKFERGFTMVFCTVHVWYFLFSQIN